MADVRDHGGQDILVVEKTLGTTLVQHVVGELQNIEGVLPVVIRVRVILHRDVFDPGRQGILVNSVPPHKVCR
eukprot:CAMPEP_0206508258 /NCGR_PEP_ID=MMETSP0324_2-20121206/58195_1 /ASSEMBLY_ACC=CAM_ASM_000836 /TAXON_ID=2866 /ORGANISM="Crypthecodinium cohnii, Strain Seligo" /LENGTH=72 /DNA_ID=CAMNT_0053999027 /DNA_START=21 /DNA_END=239 /DNA_ORIENTATION=-